MTVWVDDWQMQCCGQPFSVGSSVSWTVREPDHDWLTDVLGPEEGLKVDAAEEHHGGDDAMRTLHGTVVSIAAVHCRYSPRSGEDPKVFHAVPGSGCLTDVMAADGWTPNRADLRFTGYVVRLATEGS